MTQTTVSETRRRILSTNHVPAAGSPGSRILFTNHVPTAGNPGSRILLPVTDRIPVTIPVRTRG